MLDMTAGAIIRNESDLKRFIKDHDGASSADLVKAINISLELESSSANAGQYHRLNAGRLLRECRRKVESDPEINETWWQWQKGKFDRSRKDIEKMMRMASADDPEAAAEDERAEATERMRKVRANVRSNPLDHILELVRALTDHQRDELFTALKGEWQWQHE